MANDVFNAGASFKDATDCIESPYDVRGNKLFEKIDGELDESVELCSFDSFHKRLLYDEILDRSDAFSSLSTSLSSDASEFTSESMR